MKNECSYLPDISLDCLVDSKTKPPMDKYCDALEESRTQIRNCWEAIKTDRVIQQFTEALKDTIEQNGIPIVKFKGYREFEDFCVSDAVVQRVNFLQGEILARQKTLAKSFDVTLDDL